MPFLSTIGTLIEHYVIGIRPRSVDHHLFIRTYLGKAIPFNKEGVRNVVRKAYQEASISGRWKGTHALRRTAAYNVFNAWTGLKVTADILGYKTLESTKHYVKVDFGSLLLIAGAWPKGESRND